MEQIYRVGGNDILDSAGVTRITLGDTTTLTNSTTVLSGTSALTASSLSSIDAAAILGIDSTTLNLGNGTDALIGTLTNANLTLTPNGTGDIVLTSDSDTGVSIGSISNTPAPLSVSGGIGGNASLIVNQLNSGDILSASSSGVTRFRVANTGEVVIGDNGSNFFVTLDPTTTNLTANRTQYLPDENGTLCLQGSLSCGFALGTNYWQLNSNLVSPINSTYDFGVGGDSTTSAQFAITGVATDTPVATLLLDLIIMV